MTASLNIRPAVLAERSLLEALQWRASLDNPGDRAALLANPDAIELPPSQISAEQVFVAERAEGIVGFASVLDRGDGDTELDGLFVDPLWRRRGIGRALVDRCAAYGRARNAGAIHVVGNPHAIAFYEAYGFLDAGVEATRFGTGILMRKAL